MSTVATETSETVATEVGGSFAAGDPLTPIQSFALGIVFVYVGQRYLEHGLDELSERFGIGASIRRMIHRESQLDSDEGDG